MNAHIGFEICIDMYPDFSFNKLGYGYRIYYLHPCFLASECDDLPAKRAFEWRLEVNLPRCIAF
jgi:hypothetical protein